MTDCGLTESKLRLHQTFPQCTPLRSSWEDKPSRGIGEFKTAAAQLGIHFLAISAAEQVALPSLEPVKTTEHAGARAPISHKQRLWWHCCSASSQSVHPLPNTHTHIYTHTGQGRMACQASTWKGEWRGWGCGSVEVSRDKRVQWETALPRPFLANHIPLNGFCPVMRMLLALLNNPITDHKGSWGCGLRALRLLLKGSQALCVWRLCHIS